MVNDNPGFTAVYAYLVIRSEQTPSMLCVRALLTFTIDCSILSRVLRTFPELVVHRAGVENLITVVRKALDNPGVYSTFLRSIIPYE